MGPTVTEPEFEPELHPHLDPHFDPVALKTNLNLEDMTTKSSPRQPSSKHPSSKKTANLKPAVVVPALNLPAAPALNISGKPLHTPRETPRGRPMDDSAWVLTDIQKESRLCSRISASFGSSSSGTTQPVTTLRSSSACDAPCPCRCHTHESLQCARRPRLSRCPLLLTHK